MLNSKSLMVIVGVLFVLGTAGLTQASVVSFSNILDGNGSPLLFDTATTAPDPSDGNKLIIGLNNFTADGASATTSSAVDTLSMTITAPAGFYITSIDYTEAGTGQTANGVASATGSIVADNIPNIFLTQLFSPNTASGWSITPSTTAINNKTSIDLSITNSLFAFAFAPQEIAQITKTSASITVGLTPVPEPATLGLLTVGTIGLISRRRRNK
jgi:hypothetical protein